MRAQSVVDVILGEAAAGNYPDMLGIASVIVNRAMATGATLEDVVSAKGQFDAYGRSVPKGTTKFRDQAQAALEEVLTKGPTTPAMFYATPAATKNLPKGLELAQETAGHQYFTDPANRAIAVGDSYVQPDLSAVATAYGDPAGGAMDAEDPFAGLLGGGEPQPGPNLAGLAMGMPVGVELPNASPATQRMADGLVANGYLDPSEITSNYRDPEHNADVGGASQSQHLDGNALDIASRNWSPERRESFLDEARGLGATGIGAYGTGTIHIDNGRPRTWGPGSPGTAGPVAGLLAGDLPKLTGMPVDGRSPDDYVVEPGEAPAAPEMSFADVGSLLASAKPAPVAPAAPPDPQSRVQGAFSLFDDPAIEARVAGGFDLFGDAPPAAAPPMEAPIEVGMAPGAAAAPQETGSTAPGQDIPMGGAMDVFNGGATVGRATNGDIITRDPQTGQLTRQSQKYGYTENIDQSGNFHGFANAPEGSPAASFQDGVHGMLPGPGTVGRIGGGVVGGALGGPLGAAAGMAGGGLLADAFTGKEGTVKERIGEGLGSIAAGTVLGPMAAPFGGALGKRIASGKGLLSDGEDDDKNLGGLLGGFLSFIQEQVKQPGGIGGAGAPSYQQQGDGGNSYASRMSYSSNGAPLPPGRPGGYGSGGGGGGGVVRDGSDR